MARLRKTDGLKQRVSTLSGRAGIALTMAWLRFRRRLLYAPLYPIRLNPAAERRLETAPAVATRAKRQRLVSHAELSPRMECSSPARSRDDCCWQAKATVRERSRRTRRERRVAWKVEAAQRKTGVPATWAMNAAEPVTSRE